jgi:hypothetical protein
LGFERQPSRNKAFLILEAKLAKSHLMFLGLMTDGPRMAHATIAANKRVASKNAEGLRSLFSR